MRLIQKKIEFLYHVNMFVDYVSGAQLLSAIVLLIIGICFQSLCLRGFGELHQWASGLCAALSRHPPLTPSPISLLWLTPKGKRRARAGARGAAVQLCRCCWEGRGRVGAWGALQGWANTDRCQVPSPTSAPQAASPGLDTILIM